MLSLLSFFFFFFFLFFFGGGGGGVSQENTGLHVYVYNMYGKRTIILHGQEFILKPYNMCAEIFWQRAIPVQFLEHGVRTAPVHR